MGMTSMGDPAPIGVFDSGVGGLTVVAALRAELANEPLIYLGDTARVPYGTKSPHVVQRYAVNAARFLADNGAKLLVVACNTATAFGIHAVRDAFDHPVVGVVRPGAAMAVGSTRNGRIGVIGTEGTIASGSYQRAIADLEPDAKVVTAACPLFVPLAEEGLAKHPAARLLAEDYLKPLTEERIDTLVLGCTHYPLLARLIRKVVGPEVRLIDSATAVALAVRAKVDKLGIGANGQQPSQQFFATDVSQRVQRVGRAFLGEELGTVTLVDL